MKTKLVVWGTNAQEEKVLIALELLTESSEVNIHLFQESTVTEAFYKLMMEEWRDDKAVEFPAGYQTEQKQLSITDRLLPEGISAERDDLIVRAQTEWHFIVLSDKLNQAYKSELEELRDRIEKLNAYDAGVWEELKGFWSKVQTQLRERNLFKEHADTLRDMTNSLFSEMKQLRSKMDEEFKQKSEEQRDFFMKRLTEIEEKINQDKRLQSIFDELKKLQRKFKNTKLTKEHRTKVWDRLDDAFKTVKEKRFGPGANKDRSPLERLQKRFDGLLNAIQKMERSIQRDEDDLKFQQRKIERTDGQLEAQIRQAKLVMIEERIRSKKEKLEDMFKTRGELEKKMEVLKRKEAEQQEKERIAKAKKEAEKQIARDIKEAAKATYEDQKEELEKAAAVMEKGEEAKSDNDAAKEEGFLSAAALTLGEAFTDVVDTVRAVAEVMEDKLGETIKEVRQKAQEVKEELTEEE
jgi:chromosome segregation ATPase